MRRESEFLRTLAKECKKSAASSRLKFPTKLIKIKYFDVVMVKPTNAGPKMQDTNVPLAAGKLSQPLATIIIRTEQAMAVNMPEVWDIGQSALQFLL